MPRPLKYKLPPLEIEIHSIGQRISTARKRLGLTQTDLAKKIGITQSLVSDYETSRAHLSDEMVIRFSIALGISADEILGLVDLKHDQVSPSRKIIKRLRQIEELPDHKQKALLSTIDMALSGDS